MGHLITGMTLVIYPEYAVAGAEGTFQIVSIDDSEGNSLECITDVLTKKGHIDYHLENAAYITEIKDQLKMQYNPNLVDSLEIELGRYVE